MTSCPIDHSFLYVPRSLCFHTALHNCATALLHCYRWQLSVKLYLFSICLSVTGARQSYKRHHFYHLHMAHMLFTTIETAVPLCCFVAESEPVTRRTRTMWAANDFRLVCARVRGITHTGVLCVHNAGITTKFESSDLHICSLCVAFQDKLGQREKGKVRGTCGATLILL